MSFLHHPAFQSLVLPLLLALAAGLLLRLAGPRWTSLGAALGLVGALAVWPGFDWPASSRAQMLPWAALAGTLLAAMAVAGQWPGTRPLGQRRGRVSTAVLTLVGFALAAWAAFGGSLLLAQLALMLATVAAVLALWSWRSASVTPASLLPLWLTGIGLALCLAWLPAGGSNGSGGVDGDDPYYAPQWK